MVDKCSWQKVIDALTKCAELSGELSKFKNAVSNAERIKLCNQYALVNEKLNLWYSYHRNTETIQKDEKMALQLKMNGNKAYVMKDTDEALKFYNKALLVCPENEIALLYGNRSAVLFDKCLWEKCIKDVDVAILKGFPHEKLWKLYKRKGEALLKLQKIDDSIFSFEKTVELLINDEKRKKELDQVNKLLCDASNTDYVEIINKVTNDLNIEETDDVLFHGFNENVTSISKSLSLYQNETEGRHFVANEQIDRATMVIIEKPYASVLLPDWFQSHCQHCLVKVDTLYPCKQCTEVCYCSIECQEESWKSYHYFECGQLNLMAEIGVAHLALRIILVSDMKTLSQFFDDSSIQSQNIKGFNSDGVYVSNYESLYHLMTNVENYQPEDLFQYAAASVFLLDLLCKSDYFSADTTDDTKFQVGGLILHHMLQIICNAHAISGIESTSNISENVVEQEQVRIASALYPTASLVNHSCVPNVINVFDKDKLMVQVMKQIDKGEHIYTCYGPHYRRMDLEERQDILKKQYRFHCHCEACIKGIKSMEEFDCFLCPNCKMNICTKSMICLHCNTSIDSSLIQDYKEKSAQASEMFKLGLDLLHEMQGKEEIEYETYKEALNKLWRSLVIREGIYYKFHSSLGKTHDAIAKLYALMYNYPESILYIKRSITIVEAHYGERSMEVMNEYIKLSDVYMALMQMFIDEEELGGIEKYYADTLSTVEHCISLQLVNKSHDSSDVKDLKSKHASLLKLYYLKQPCKCED